MIYFKGKYWIIRGYKMTQFQFEPKSTKLTLTLFEGHPRNTMNFPQTKYLYIYNE